MLGGRDLPHEPLLGHSGYLFYIVPDYSLSLLILVGWLFRMGNGIKSRSIPLPLIHSRPHPCVGYPWVQRED